MPRLILLVSLIVPFALAGPELTVLENGLTVITEEMHYAPVVSTVMVYRVGARNEPEGLTGMSHFCEHMMFKGTVEMPKGRFWQIVQRNGGWANAFTSEDVTAYFLIFPSTRLEDALRIESDRMSHCLFDSVEVTSERNVVHEERRMTSVDSPSGALYEALTEAAFTTHPYRHPVVGYDEDILAYDRESALRYYRSHYTPSNAVLCVIGDFDTPLLMEMVEDLFGPLEDSGSPAGGKPPAEPPQTGDRYVEIEHASNVGRVDIAFHTPDGSHPDTPALDLIALHLAGGRSSRLESLLVRTGMVSSVGAWNDGGIDPGLFTISATLMPGVAAEEVIEAVWSELEALASGPIDSGQLEDLRSRMRAAHVLQASSPVGRAIRLALDQAMFGDYGRSDASLEVIEGLTPERIEQVARSYLCRGQSTIAVLVPSGGAGAIESRERESLPTDIQEPSAVDFEGLEIDDEMLELPTSSIADGMEEAWFANGLRLIVKADTTFPVVTISFGIPLASYRQPPELAGLAGIACDAALYGTEELSYEEFHRRLERRGSYVRFGAGEEYSSGSITLLTEDLELGLETVSDLLMRPAFRRDDLDHVLEEHMAALERRRESIFGVAMDNLSRMMCASPELAMVPTEETIGAIDSAAVVDFFDLCSRPDGAVLVVVGDIDPERVRDIVSERFEDWEPPEQGELPSLAGMEPSQSPGGLHVETMPGRAQAAVVVGGFAPGYASPDYETFRIMNRILGGGIGSRLGRYVRDEQGLAYYVGTRLYTFQDSGAILALLSTRSDYVERAMTSVIETVERMSVEEVDPIELRLVQASMVGNHALANMSYAGVAGTLLDCAMRSRPLDYEMSRLEAALSLEPSDIREAAATYLQGSARFVSVAGGVDDRLAPVTP